VAITTTANCGRLRRAEPAALTPDAKAAASSGHARI